MSQPTARDRLIVALDADPETAARLTTTLGDAVSFYKIGLELVCSGYGLALAETLAGNGKQVFLDLKLHDIGATVEKAAAAVAKIGATFLTVHAYPQTMEAAMRGVAGSDTKILGVTVLTSYNKTDLGRAGYGNISVETLVSHRAREARDIGVHGLVLAAGEAEPIRFMLGPDMLLVTPGIRPAGADLDDQKRVMTPAQARAAGADYIVVGRPITRADDPRAAADAIVAELEAP